MFRKVIRVLAILFLLGSLAIGAFATYVWLTPSDEQKLYDAKYQEAQAKLKQWEAAKGTPAETRLAREFKEAADSAEVWGRGHRERAATNRLGVIACGVVFFGSFIVFLLTFIGRKKSADPSPPAWSTQNQGYSQPGGQRGQPPHN
jgi:hypothetical protein